MSLLYSPESPDNSALRELRDSVKELNKTTQKANRLMLWLTTAILIATVALVVQGFKFI